MAHIYNAQLDAFSLYHQVNEVDSSPSLLRAPVLPALGHAISGSTGSAISNLAIYPLDLIITRLQTQRQLRTSFSLPEANEYKGVLDAAVKIYREGGLAAFYHGVLQDTGKSIADAFLFFLFYHHLRQSRIQRAGGPLPALDELAVGALAGACSKFLTAPLANIVTRKQTAAMSRGASASRACEWSVAEIASQIRSEKGIPGFWSGYSASLLLTLNPSITMFLHAFLTRALLPRANRDDPGPRLTFLLAAVSKAFASSITYPLSVAKARAQTSSRPRVDPLAAGNVAEETRAVANAKSAGAAAANAKSTGAAAKNASKPAARSTVFATIFHIYRTEGLGALYEGILGEICKGFFSHGTTMLVKEAVHKLIIQTYYILLQALPRAPADMTARATDVAVHVSAGAKDAVEGGTAALAGAQHRAGIAIREAGGRVRAAGRNVSEVATAGASRATTLAGEKTRDVEAVVGNGLVGAGTSLEETGTALRGDKE